MHVPAPHLHLDTPHARLDEPPGEQTSLPELRAAISFAGLLVLPRDVEGRQIAAAHQPHSLDVHPVVGLDLPSRIVLLEIPVEPVGEREPPLEVALREIAGPRDVFQASLGVGEWHGRDGGIEEAAAGMLVAVADEHVAGEVAAPLA